MEYNNIMNIIKKLKQLFCEHEKFKEVDVYTYYNEVSGSYFKSKKLQCVKCGKIFR